MLCYIEVVLCCVEVARMATCETELGTGPGEVAVLSKRLLQCTAFAQLIHHVLHKIHQDLSPFYDRGSVYEQKPSKNNFLFGL